MLLGSSLSLFLPALFLLEGVLAGGGGLQVASTEWSRCWLEAGTVLLVAGTSGGWQVVATEETRVLPQLGSVLLSRFLGFFFFLCVSLGVVRFGESLWPWVQLERPEMNTK